MKLKKEIPSITNLAITTALTAADLLKKTTVIQKLVNLKIKLLLKIYYHSRI